MNETRLTLYVRVFRDSASFYAFILCEDVVAASRSYSSIGQPTLARTELGRGSTGRYII